MIDFLRGKPVFVDTDFVVLDVRDVGYRVFCANPYAVAAKGEEPVTLFIHHHVREDAIQLFGFGSREEQSLFRKLLDVSGIGPRVAIGVLSGGSPERIARAIEDEDITFLTRLPGIGRKTAQRMVLDLKDKLDGIGAGAPSGTSSGGEVVPTAAAAAAHGTPASIASAWREAKEALLSLGYSESETERAWRDIRNKTQEGAGPDALIKLALQALYQAK
ncbi:Holliday junction branch migration protein RuvA [Paenibacillus alkalitolerans]|uniref:Holliday junction branch migration protein RuvA n=1 Tax=Paenibacillus alkalitolerans TaxID=2799335 RepID=UPI0018F2C544|nr:Holliday junction branch migration protein RuvA [Paenibacillus alkalitolerans]